jgi:transposase
MKTAWETLEKPAIIEQLSELNSRNSQLELELQKLKFELDQLKRMIFGSKSERFVPSQSSEQYSLGFEVDILEEETTKEEVSYTREKKKRKEKPVRLPLPAHLPRTEIIIEPEGDLSEYKKIGEEITEELEYQPGKLFVNKYVRPKYVKKGWDGVLTASLPSGPIEKGIPGVGLLAQIAVDKFMDHLPIYRQCQRYQRDGGVRLPASTLGGWLAHICKTLDPLYLKLREVLLTSNYIQADESPIKVLEKQKKKGKAHRGYQWVYNAPVERLVMFDYQPGRDASPPKAILKDFQGHLQTDGYSVYPWFDKQSGIDQLQCMAHARREFEQALGNDKERGQYALTEIGKLYDIEREAREKNMTHQERYELRQEKAIVILERMGDWIKEQLIQVLPKSPIGTALAYSSTRWKMLSLYTKDGKLEIDNNLVENAIRPLALGRKNYLFAGSHDAAQRIAMFYSFFGSCTKNGVNPYQWLKKVLNLINDHPVNQLDKLLPTNTDFFETKAVQ